MKKLIFTIIFTIFLACGNSVTFADSKIDSITVSQIDTISVAITKEVNIPDTVIEAKGKKYVLHFEIQKQSQETISKPEPWYRSTWAEYIMMILLFVALALAIKANLDNACENLDNTCEEDKNKCKLKEKDSKFKGSSHKIQRPCSAQKESTNFTNVKEPQVQPQVPDCKTTNKKKVDNSKASASNLKSSKESAGKTQKVQKKLWATTGEDGITLTLVNNDKYDSPIFVITLDYNDHTKGTYKVIDEDDVKKKFAQNSDQQKYCSCQGQGETITKQEPGEVTNIDEKNNSATITKKAIITLGLE